MEEFSWKGAPKIKHLGHLRALNLSSQTLLNAMVRQRLTAMHYTFARWASLCNNVHISDYVWLGIHLIQPISSPRLGHDLSIPSIPRTRWHKLWFTSDTGE